MKWPFSSRVTQSQQGNAEPFPLSLDPTAIGQITEHGFCYNDNGIQINTSSYITRERIEFFSNQPYRLVFENSFLTAFRLKLRDEMAHIEVSFPFAELQTRILTSNVKKLNGKDTFGTSDRFGSIQISIANGVYGLRFECGDLPEPFVCALPAAPVKALLNAFEQSPFAYDALIKTWRAPAKEDSSARERLEIQRMLDALNVTQSDPIENR